MPPNKSNYSKRPVRRVRLPRIGLRKTKSLFEEYFYAFLVTISVVVTILGKAVGLSGYDAIVTGLWVGGFTWFAWQVSRYRKEQTGTGSTAKSGQAVQAAPHMTKMPLPPNMKRSEEHTSELQSQSNLVCRLLLEKKKKHRNTLHPLSRYVGPRDYTYLRDVTSLPDLDFSPSSGRRASHTGPLRPLLTQCTTLACA